MGSATLTRQVFKVQRYLDFFSESGLTAQIGYGRDWWGIVILKELIDNALDGCESADLAPKIKIVLEEDSLIVSDNGPGLPESTIVASLNYDVRVSDKVAYCSPSRGQLGNALKCLWAVAYVCSEDQHGVVEVDSTGIHHRIEITGSNQSPRILPTTTKSSVKKGTIVKMAWPGIASFLSDPEIPSFYKVVQQFALLNPHATFSLQEPDKELRTFSATAKHFRKWRPNDPTSSYWYDKESFQHLVATYVGNGQANKTVREFVSEFNGLSGSRRQKEVVEQAKVSGQTLGDLTERSMMILHAAMMEATREVLPQRLGVIGAEHFRKMLLASSVSENSFEYKKILGSTEGLPFVVEAAFGVTKRRSDVRDLLLGLNFSPTFRVPSQDWEHVIDRAEIDVDDPVVLAITLVTPKLRFTTLGKGEIASEMLKVREAIASAVERVTRRYTKTKRRAQRHGNQRVKQAHLDEIAAKREEKRDERETLKSAAYRVMKESYEITSGDGSLPVHARQVFYTARPLVLAITGGLFWKSSDTFTQTLLPDFQKEHPKETKNWNVHYDARGHFREPHTGVRLGVGTLEVRRYLAAWRTKSVSTYGPANRFQSVIFIEKEGFDQLIDASRIAERFDLGFLSTKGMSTTAARELVEGLSDAEVTIYTAHDLDLSGKGIFHTLGHDTRRYEFVSPPNVVDLGLTLADVKEMKLASEAYIISQKKDPTILLAEYGATPEELEFLIGNRHYDGTRTWWDATRVELNAMTSPQIIAWLERKLIENGVEKLVPGSDLLGTIWQEGQRVRAYNAFRISDGEYVRAIEAQLEEAKAQLEKDFNAHYKPPRTPEDLQEQVAEYLHLNPLVPWDTAIAQIAGSNIENRR